MLTLTASPRTIRTPAPVTTYRRTQASATAAPRPSFWMTLLRALAVAAA